MPIKLEIQIVYPLVKEKANNIQTMNPFVSGLRKKGDQSDSNCMCLMLGEKRTKQM